MSPCSRRGVERMVWNDEDARRTDRAGGNARTIVIAKRYTTDGFLFRHSRRYRMPVATFPERKKKALRGATRTAPPRASPRPPPPPPPRTPPSSGDSSPRDSSPRRWAQRFGERAGRPEHRRDASPRRPRADAREPRGFCRRGGARVHGRAAPHAPPAARAVPPLRSIDPERGEDDAARMRCVASSAASGPRRAGLRLDARGVHDVRHLLAPP